MHNISEDCEELWGFFMLNTGKAFIPIPLTNNTDDQKCARHSKSGMHQWITQDLSQTAADLMGKETQTYNKTHI